MEEIDGSNPTPEDRNGSTVHSIAAKAEEKVRDLSETARVEAGQRARRIGGLAQQRIDAERERVALRIEGVATTLRERGDGAGPIGHTAGEQVATRMEATAAYLQQHPTEEIAGDVTTYVKQHPFKSVVAAAVLGYLVGRIAA